MIYMLGETCMFIHADSVLVHRLSSDSLMTSCPHITSLSQSEGQWNQRHREEQEGEEGGRECKTIWETETACTELPSNP